MKSFLQKILPWHLRQTLSAARFFHAKRKPTFEGAYTRFDDAPAGIAGAKAWRENAWTASSRAQAEKWRAQVGAALPESAQFSKALLPMLVAAATREGPLRILDFGGGAGLDYAHLLAALGDARGGTRIDVAYHVVDMPESCEVGRVAWRDDSRITFSDAPPSSGTRFDVVYAFCSAFLVEDFRKLFATFAGYRPAHILLCKTPVHEGPSFVRRQINLGPAMENAQWAFGLDDLIEALEPHGYTLTYRGYGEDSYNVDNYDDAHAVGRMANLLFSRRAE